MRIAILGTGLIGASIGMRLRGTPGLGAEVVGFDRYRDVARDALRAGALDRTTETPQEAVEGAELVVLAAPVLAIRRLLEEIAPALGAHTTVTDTGSTKSQVMRWAAELLPSNAVFVGGHPMAGKTETGPGAADGRLFEGARWIIVPAVQSTERATNTVLWLAEQMGAEPMYMDADEHDAYVAAVSHMPMVAATTLFSMEHASEAWPELSQLAAGGFKDSTRLAATDPAMAYDIMVTNREHTVHWLDRYIAALRDARDRLADTEHEQELFRTVAATQFEYEAYRGGRVGRDEGKQPVDSSAASFQDFMVGTWVREKMEEISRGAEERAREDAERRRLRRDI